MQVLGFRVVRIEKFTHENSTDKLIVSKEFREICVILSSDCRSIASCQWLGGCVSCSLESVTLACNDLGFRVLRVEEMQ